MQNNQKIIGTNEILGSMLSSKAEDINALKSDPEAFILSTYNVALPDSTNVAVVENSNETVNLALPYYPNMEQRSAKSLSDLDAGDISGGEISIAVTENMITSRLAVAGEIGKITFNYK